MSEMEMGWGEKGALIALGLLALLLVYREFAFRVRISPKSPGGGWPIYAPVWVTDGLWLVRQIARWLLLRDRWEAMADKRGQRLVRIVLCNALLIAAYIVATRNLEGVIGWADVILFSGILLHWLVWAANPYADATDQSSGQGGGKKGNAIWDNHIFRLAWVALIALLYGFTASPYVPSGTIRYVHSHLGERSALQGREIQCGPRLQAVLPMVDRVYDYPIGFQRLEFSEGGGAPPIRTETRNGHEIELDVAVVYRMFPGFAREESEKSCEEAARSFYSASAADGDQPQQGQATELSPPQRFRSEWQQRWIDPLVQRAVRDNVNRYYLNQVYSSDSRSLIQALILQALKCGTSARLKPGAKPGTERGVGPGAEATAGADGGRTKRPDDDSTRQHLVPEAAPGVISEDVRRRADHLLPQADPLFYPPLIAPLARGERDRVPFLIEVTDSRVSTDDPIPYELVRDDTVNCVRAGAIRWGEKGEMKRCESEPDASSKGARCEPGHGPAGGLFEFREVVILDVRIVDREFAKRIRQKHLREEAREELLIEKRRLEQELENVVIRKRIELQKALIEADKVKIEAEASLQKAKLEAEGIEKRGVAEANARKMLVSAHGGKDSAYTQIEVARHLAAGIDRVIVTPDLDNMVPIISDIGEVMRVLAAEGMDLSTARTPEQKGEEKPGDEP